MEYITNEKILKYIKECIANLKDLNILRSDWGNDIEYIQNKSVHTFGSMMAPKHKGENFKLTLSEYMFKESERALKNTIYHELCHYIQMKQQLELGILWYNDKNELKFKFSIKSNKYESSHGGRWKELAERVSKATGYYLTVISNYDLHTEVGKQYNKTITYIITCKKCGKEFKYQRKTAFVQAVLKNDTKRWYCPCGCREFELTKVSE